MIAIHNHTTEEEDYAIDWALPLAFVKKRHIESIEGGSEITQTWRMKERMKTVSVALVLCLNVGVDPPDVVKTQPCARLECWIDPLSMSPQKALETIGSNLQKQYERWQPRARYKQSLDPTAEEVKKLCTSLRRNAKEERVLFHYNGHGVPKPTSNGEIWVFNRTYTQYIPLSVYDLQTWMGAPSIYIYDCSNAGIIVDSFKQFADQHEKEYKVAAQSHGTVNTPPSFKNCIQLAACSANQILPMNPDLPADVFTSCLTTPIKIALRWFVIQNSSKLVSKLSLDIIDKIPGQLNDRRTMLGELNWIFTAITDTIAWNTLPRDVFQKLFRQDLLVASLFRNFLLAERIMRSYDCTPVSSPKLPPTYQHPMWQAWDMALDLCLSQLPAIMENEEQFVHSPFFEEQLTAFEVWLGLGSDRRSPPEQLPIVLQVLLSQVHRLRALELLGRFLDLGPWAVNLALSVGIFPYVLKLLQSSARELRPLLVFIWAKILAVDGSCQADLVRDNGHKYFLSVLQDTSIPGEDRTLAAFVLASMVKDYPPGQEAALQGSLVSICLEQLGDASALLRQWLAICLGRLWHKYEKARWCGVRDIAPEKLNTLLQDPVPEVRAAAVYALGTFINSVTERSEHANNIDHTIAMTLLNTVSYDMSPLVRKELVVALQWIVLIFENSFLSVCLQEESRRGESTLSPQTANVPDLSMSPIMGMRRIASRDRLKTVTPVTVLSTDGAVSPAAVASSDFIHTERIKRVSSSSSICSLGHGNLSNLPTLSFGSIYMKLWHGLTALDHDPHPGVSHLSHMVTSHIRDQIKDSTATKDVGEMRMTPSLSLPPSPSSRSSFLAGESPPTSTASTTSTIELHKFSSSRTHTPRPRRVLHNTISEEADDNARGRRPLVKTQFVEWSSKYFAQSATHGQDDNDVESDLHYEREWRYQRNHLLRIEARDEQRRILSSKLESQVFNARNPNAPSVIAFHPYDTHIAVAGKDSFGIWDWVTGVKQSYCYNRASKQSRITSLDFVNGHDVSLLLVGSDDGTVRLWGNYTLTKGKEPVLVTAWHALSDIQNPRQNSGAGLVTHWEQKSQQLVVTGDARVIRLWDAESELKVQDIPTGADCCITSISSDDMEPALIAAGCGDGSVRLFDRRKSSQEARIMTWREHATWVVNVQLRNHNKIVSGCVSGDVRFFDIRKNSAVAVRQTTHGVTAMAIHRVADTFACGSMNQFINVYGMDGNALNTIKYHEGFMGPRIGAVSCLAFHPYRVCLAAGCVDTSISVYSIDPKR
ncbi:regulatory-associated protein of mTOR isoform X1 [Schistocerca americana]|nr:regulatory-associated protein of mTOR isoform X1 [Schistocerca americana]XP_049951504.1 regulatory-associated protein of mTOR isoform X1 [Schistocerca serialis cubense]